MCLQDGLDAYDRKDYKEVVKWYKLSAEQDYSPAQNNLGDVYKILQEYTISHKWYNIAGVNGFERALKSRDIVEKNMTPAQTQSAKIDRETKVPHYLKIHWISETDFRCEEKTG